MKYHRNEPTQISGTADEGIAVLMLHGRGATAESMLVLFSELDTCGVMAVAPAATDRTWYPNSFLAPLESNRPYLDDAFARVDFEVEKLMEQGVGSDRIVLLGFSQGACLTLEYAARFPRRYGAVIGLTGGLIGPDGTTRNYPGDLHRTPVFLGTSDPDPHVPFARVEETKNVLLGMNAEVELRRYPGMAHTINSDELKEVERLIRNVGKGES